MRSSRSRGADRVGSGLPRVPPRRDTNAQLAGQAAADPPGAGSETRNALRRPPGREREAGRRLPLDIDSLQLGPLMCAPDVRAVCRSDPFTVTATSPD